jgi:hypothetical protein
MLAHSASASVAAPAAARAAPGMRADAGRRVAESGRGFMLFSSLVGWGRVPESSVGRVGIGSMSVRERFVSGL